jgi:hypothetical protein
MKIHTESEIKKANFLRNENRNFFFGFLRVKFQVQVYRQQNIWN